MIKPKFDALDHEAKLTRQNQQLMDLLAQRAKQPKRVSLAEAKKRLGVDKSPRSKASRGARRQAAMIATT